MFIMPPLLTLPPTPNLTPILIPTSLLTSLIKVNKSYKNLRASSGRCDTHTSMVWGGIDINRLHVYEPDWARVQCVSNSHNCCNNFAHLC